MKYKTAESVTLGHPDKLSDYIADSILDACLKQDPDSRVACEVMLSHEVMMIAGEITTKAKVDYQSIAEAAIKEAGYEPPDSYVDDIVEQSPDIKQAVDDGWAKELGAGDQGIMYGYSTDETLDHLPLPCSIAHRITNKLTEIGRGYGLGPDGKAQVTVAYGDGGCFHRIETVLVSIQHEEAMNLEEVQKIVTEKVLEPILADFQSIPKAKIIVNPSGRFVLGGFRADTGLTGRKLMVDTYGGLVRHGGGAMSGKDPSKVDRSGAYMARYVANTVVNAGLAEQCEVSIAYAIGQAQPVMVEVDTHGTWNFTPDRLIAEAVRKTFDFSPAGIINELNLKFIQYKKAAAFGHFGAFTGFPWEKTDKAKEAALRKALKEVVSHATSD